MPQHEAGIEFVQASITQVVPAAHGVVEVPATVVHTTGRSLGGKGASQKPQHEAGTALVQARMEQAVPPGQEGSLTRPHNRPLRSSSVEVSVRKVPSEVAASWPPHAARTSVSSDAEVDEVKRMGQLLKARGHVRLSIPSSGNLG